MNRKSSQPSVPANSPVDPAVVCVLRSLNPIAQKADCAYFVAGATARDLILVNVYGLRPGRATVDIDLGVAVGSWQQLAILKERLIETGEFAADRRALQRLTYAGQTATFTIPVDLIPFRGVASAEGTISWPPHRDIVMNVAGFEEAFQSSVLIEMAEGLDVHVASIPGLTLLKLNAWADRGRQSNKDAADIYRLLTTYADAGNTDRLYDQELDLLEAAGFDMELAGAELLGRDVAHISSPLGIDRVRSLFASEPGRELLVNQMARSTYAEAAARVEQTMSRFCQGLQRPK
ncbi:MAG TPA: nucleotidyl transferase AbiEii/AbiGii toxin family protein [Bryobacteraceae bacterium]|nr:nucleotidyl transferase AbiEii/AbiGii toxin family protein [Bryobacteraceae bacterium]